MKQLISCLLAATLIFALGACSAQGTPDGKPSQPTVTPSTQQHSITPESTPTITSSSSTSTQAPAATINPADVEQIVPLKDNTGNAGGNGKEQGKKGPDMSYVNTQYLDVAYGTLSSAQTMDVYLPNDGTEPFPVIVAIHGGAFKGGSSRGGNIVSVLSTVKYGYAVFSVNYRLSGEATFPRAVNDVKAAIRFIKANADKYNVDPDKIAVWGESAGGNLAAMVGTTSDVDSLYGDMMDNLEYSSAVQAVVDWFGPLDFLAMDSQFASGSVKPNNPATDSSGSPESQFIGQLISKDTAFTQLANPATYISDMNVQTAPSFYIQHGTSDGNVPYQQSEVFAELLTNALGKDKVTIDLLNGAGHGGAQFDSAANMQKVIAFLDSVLK